MSSLTVRSPVPHQLPQINERERPRTRTSKSRLGRTPKPEVDSGAYRAHFKKWWEDVGRAQQHETEDPMITIGNRLQEVTDMVTPRNTREITMNMLHTPLRNKVRELSIMTPGTFRRVRRNMKDKDAKFDPAQRFSHAIKCVLIVVSIAMRRRRYVQTGPVRGPLDSEIRSDEYGHSWFSKSGDNQSKGDTTPPKTVIGSDDQCIFRMQPKWRTSEELERLALKIRTIKTFEMFPTKMEEELVRRMSYSCFDDGRVLAYQDSTPRRFYYIISGEVRLLRTYKLESGEVTKPVGSYKRGYNTPREELEKRTPRSCHLVCKGNVEVFTLEIDDFLYLIDPPDPPPLNFLREQPMFLDFPVDEFLNHPESIRSKYFPPNTLICDDANHTKWIYLVLSGQCSYLRKQCIPGEGNANTQPMVGGGPIGGNRRHRRPSHANELIEMSIARYVAKRRTSNATFLPEMPENSVLNTESSPIRTSVVEEGSSAIPNPHGQTIGLPPISREDTRSISPHSRASRRSRSPSTVYNHDLPPLARAGAMESQGTHLAFSPERGASDRRNSMFLTERSRTEVSITRGPGYPMQRSKTFPSGGGWERRRGGRQKRVFLQLGKLQSGDIFGLNEVLDALQVEPSGVSVVSGGAEVISISKRFFRQHAGVLTLLNLESKIQEFVNEEDAKDHLQEASTWSRYKQSVVKTLATDKAEKTRDKRSTRMKLNPLTGTI